MGAGCVVVDAPGFDDAAGVPQPVEQVFIQAFVRQPTHCRWSSSERRKFFPSISCGVEAFIIDSARSLLSRAFSYSSTLSRLASDASMPPLIWRIEADGRRATMALCSSSQRYCDRQRR